MRRVILAIVATAAGLALLLSFKTHASSSISSSTTTPTTNDTGNSGASAPSPASSGSAGAGGSGAGGSGAGGKPSSTSTGARTVAGDVTQTNYGPIQVTITVADRKITAVKVPEYPTGTPRDEQINQVAVPQLIQETLAANSARIDSVSGATYTSQGYITSLQSAIDKAGL